MEEFIFGGAYIRRGLSREGNLLFKIDWASLIVGSKFIVLALFYFVFEGNFLSTSPQGAYIWRGDFTGVFFALPVCGHKFGGAYTWRGLFSEFYGILLSISRCFRPFYDTSGLFQKISEGYRRLQIMGKYHLTLNPCIQTLLKEEGLLLNNSIHMCMVELALKGFTFALASAVKVS